MINLQNSQFKSLEQLQQIAPSIFTTKGSNSTSERYAHIPTYKVINDMELLGWGVIDAKEVKSRVNKGYQKHLVVFRNNDIVINGENNDVVYPQILLTNSHDGKNSFNFTSGLFRLVCENGLVIATEEFEDVKIRHFKYEFEELQKVIKNMVEILPLTVESMNKMKEVELQEEQMISLAKELLELRIDTEKNGVDDETINSVLSPQRNEDMGNGLWEVFNRIQENILEGNFSYLGVKGKKRNARKIKNFQQDMLLNKQMFSKALEYTN
jgi:hypothetical protein